MKEALNSRKGSLRVANLLKTGSKKKREDMDTLTEETEKNERNIISDEANVILKSFRLIIRKV